MVAGHGFTSFLVGHDLLFHLKEIVEAFYLRLPDDGPKALTADVGEDPKGFETHSLHDPGDPLELVDHVPHFARLAMHDFAYDVHGEDSFLLIGLPRLK
jgi:hypothetical protein